MLARALHAAVATAALAGVAIELVTALVEGPGAAPSHAERIVRLLSYFTILSNLLVGGVSALLAARPDHDGRLFRVLHLDAVLCITVTGIVYHRALTGLVELTPAGALTNFLLHTVSPVLAVVAWLLAGPRPRTDGRTVALGVVPPLLWIAYTFARGAATGWYPYPFLDVGEVGVGGAAAATAVVAVVFLLLAGGVRLLERVLPRAPRASRAPDRPGHAPGR
ncbi:Pr6Pr family membrane protein [Cellulomonas endophytica]|uniref:Pr6Pr family membrane protein n=1 Tax=Cellulomonas endophytica TaxID=2494735 RepID=UPI001011AE8F|nr:Pr6Pr family membrane protein [Cellulomonas endophytica]